MSAQSWAQAYIPCAQLRLQDCCFSVVCIRWQHGALKPRRTDRWSPLTSKGIGVLIVQMFIMIIIAEIHSVSPVYIHAVTDLLLHFVSLLHPKGVKIQNNIVSLSPFFPQNILTFIFLCSIFNRNTEKKNIFLEIDISILCVFRVKRPSQHWSLSS